MCIAWPAKQINPFWHTVGMTLERTESKGTKLFRWWHEVVVPKAKRVKWWH